MIRDTFLFLCDLFNDYKKRIENQRLSLSFAVCRCLLLSRFDSEAGEAGELEARETGDEHARDHGKEKEERRNACKNSCRFLANFVVFLARYFSRVFKP